MNFTLKIWRQKDAKSQGAFETYKVENISSDTSFLEMMDILNNTVSIRHRKDGDLGSMSLEDFKAMMKEEIDTKAIK